MIDPMEVSIRNTRDASNKFFDMMLTLYRSDQTELTPEQEALFYKLSYDVEFTLNWTSNLFETRFPHARSRCARR